jgi:NAD(P)H-dependent flavin oxidoreductase YrpB (nitropropane dioxygenase family)
MGGGLSDHRLAAAVSDAGGLGTIAVRGPRAIERELAAARSLTPRPVAVNLLLPFARRDWFEAAAGADVVVTFWGTPRRRVPGAWWHQCGSAAEARAAHAAGADAVIVQGVEAGGHVRGTAPGLALLERVRAELPAGFPVLLAGAIVDRDGVAEALAAGAAAAVAGTRFLASEESRAHPAYKRRLLDARETVLTRLFGLGWPAPHRVIANEATARWLAGGAAGPRATRAVNRLLGPGARRMPAGVTARLVAGQHPGRRLLLPAAATDRSPARLVESGPLYAGQGVAHVARIAPAAALVKALTP